MFKKKLFTTTSIIVFAFLMFLVVTGYNILISSNKCGDHGLKCGENELCNLEDGEATCVQMTLCPEQRDDFCITLYKPVCGNDYVTYSNGCVACSNEHVMGYIEGVCPEIK